MSSSTGAPESLPGIPQLPERIGPFLIHGVLGRGGMGVVFDAEKDGTGQRVALKVIRPLGDPGRSKLLIARFLREAKILEQLNHPGVVRLVDSGDHDGILYLAMERIEGVSLLTIRRKAPLGFDALVQLGIQMCDALAHMHEAGVVHRDIKPANILIDSTGRPIITDFGISGMETATGITRQGDLLGSPGFMAHEVIEGAPPTAQSDQFALGRLLYELGAVGPAKKLPKNAPLLQLLAAAMEIDWERFPKEDLWPKLRTILERMLARRPDDRFPDARSCLGALQKLTTADLLDSETLSEHLDYLSLPRTTSWEAEATVIGDEIEAADELISNLELPAGARPQPGVTDERDKEDTEEEKPAPMKVSISDLEHPAFGTPAADEDETKTEPPAGPLPPRPQLKLPTFSDADPTIRPPGPEPKIAEPSLHEPEPKEPEEDGTVALPESKIALPSLKQVQQPKQADAMPLNEIRRESSLVMEGGSYGDGPEPIELQIPRLERQVNTMREQLADARHQLQLRRHPPRLPWILACVGVLIIGVVVGVLFGRLPPPVPHVVIVPSRLDNLAPPLYQNRTEPDEKSLAASHEWLRSAIESLKNRDLDGAQGYLELCIKESDLPDCHKTLGNLLAITRHPSARTHLEHYLLMSPNAPDAEEIRKKLKP